MNTIILNQNKYPILISNSFNDFFVSFMENVNSNKVLIITDSNVDKLYSDEISYILKKHNVNCFKYVITPGENSKNLNTIHDIYNACLKYNLDKNSCLISLGGGVVGDITGFVASTFLRGISYIQLPTTIISQVDSSIGGKTGVNYNDYKNIVGSFYNPKMVYINILTLSSLENRHYLSGISEIIKYGIIRDIELLTIIENNIEQLLIKDSEILQKVIIRCCEIKSEIVLIDEKDNGIRNILNFGHTVGHAIESASNFELFHGESIVLGMIVALKIGLKLKKINQSEYDSVYNLFQKFSLIKNIKNVRIGKIIDNLKYDKKIDNNKIKFIIPNGIGNSEIIDGIDEESLVEALLEMGLKLNF